MFAQRFAGIRKQERSLIPREDLEKALARLCAPPPMNSKSGTRPSISDEVFHRICVLLKDLEIHLGEQGWSSRARTYTVLRNIGCANLMPAFIALGLNDYSFPYSFDKLPEVLRDDAIKDKFMNFQRHVLTDATELENGAEGSHAHTKNGEDLYFVVRHLGSGGFGSVDLVFSRLSHKQYARKQFMRKRNFRDDQSLVKRFALEVSSLKRLSHHHLVSVIGSYTDQKSVAFLMEPIGECNLMTYLQQPRAFVADRLPSLRNYFGCLANAVAYLHRNRIRHRDLKPQNILVENHRVYITDFGNALDWSKSGRDTTNDSNVPFTERYVAPEVAGRSASSKNSASDVWSLGVVFLDMITVLRGSTIKGLHVFLETHGTRHPFVWGNSQATNQWFEEICRLDVGPESDNEPLVWIKDLTQSSPNNRPSSADLTGQIRSAAALGNFIGHCCAIDDDMEAYSSPPQSSHSEENADIHLDDLPPELELGGKPFGSLVESSRQSSIERWLSVSAGQEEFMSDVLSGLSDFIGGNIIDVPYDIVEDDPTMATIVPNQEPLESQSIISQRSVTLDRCEGYDIVEDDSDDEGQPGDEGIGYEVTEDSSGSEVTVRVHASASKARTICRKDSRTTVTVTSPSCDQGIGDLSPEAILSAQNRLDVLLEDDIESSAQESVRATSPGLPGSAQAIQGQLDTSFEDPSSNQDQDRAREMSPLHSKPAQSSRADLDRPMTVTVNTFRTQAKFERETNDASVDEAQIYIQDATPEKPPDASKLESPNETNLARPAKLMTGITKSKKTQAKPKPIEREPDDLLADKARICIQAATPEKSPDTPKLESKNATNLAKPAKVTTGITKSKKTQAKPKPIERETNNVLADKARINIQDATSEKPPDAPKLESLNAANLTRLANVTTETAKSNTKGKLFKRNIRDVLADKPQISPSAYMQEVWEAASSAATSVMSQKTRKTLGGFGSGLAYQDRTVHFLEKYVKAGKAAAVRELLNAGCNPGTKKAPRIRPLMLAVKGGSQRHNKCLAALLSHGADVNARENSGKTALHYAIEHQNFHGYTNLIRDLLEAGADPNNKDKSGDFPLLQILYGGSEPLEKHKRDALACLLREEFAADVNVVPPGTRNMPLHLAVRRKDPWAVSMLLTRGAQVNEPNGSGMTPLMLAANAWSTKLSYGQIEVLRFLLEGGVNVNERNEMGKTALHLAASSLCQSAADLLLNRGADPVIKDKEGRKACFYAGDSPIKVRKAPEAHAAIMMMLFDAMGHSSLDTMEGECAVVTAVIQSWTEDAEVLFSSGAHVDLLDESTQRSPLLHLALRKQDFAMAQLLIDKGALLKSEDVKDRIEENVCADMDPASFTKLVIQDMKNHGKRFRFKSKRNATP